MADDAQELNGKWAVSFMHWKWEYTFSADGRVQWRDPLNNMSGTGRWAKTGGVINFSWAGSTTKETWNRPIRPEQQTGWISASYGSHALKAQKIMTATPGLSDGESYSGLEDAIDLPSGSPPEINNV